MSLNFVSFRELRSSTTRINNMLSNEGKIVVTNQGKPAAIMLQVSESTLEETLTMINQFRLSKAINNMRLNALRCGASGMSLDEINEEITRSRYEKHEIKAVSEENV